MVRNNELEMIRKEEVVACFEVLSIHLCGVNEQHYASHCQDCWCPHFLLITQASWAHIALKKKTVSTVLLDMLIYCNKFGYMFRSDIVLSSGHSNIHT